MRRWLPRLVAFALLAASAPVLAAEPRTAVLRIEGMNCALCPLTVRKALERVPGVLEARVDYESKRARVTYDPDKAGPEALAKAVSDAGYPAKAEAS